MDKLYKKLGKEGLSGRTIRVLFNNNIPIDKNIIKNKILSGEMHWRNKNKSGANKIKGFGKVAFYELCKWSGILNNQMKQFEIKKCEYCGQVLPNSWKKR